MLAVNLSAFVKLREKCRVVTRDTASLPRKLSTETWRCEVVGLERHRKHRLGHLLQRAFVVVLVKVYGEPLGTEKRYSPGEYVRAYKEVIRGCPAAEHVSTSYSERQNLNVRTGQAPLGFSDT